MAVIPDRPFVFFGTRVNESFRSVDEDHGFFTKEQLEGFAFPETPGDLDQPMTGKLPHHSVRPKSYSGSKGPVDEGTTASARRCAQGHSDNLCQAEGREVLMTPTTESLQWSSGQPISGVTIAALGADDAVLAVGATLYLAQLSGTVAAVVQQWTLDEAPRAVAVSPSREYILAVDARHVRVWKRGDARPLLELEASGDARMGATFGRSNGVDVLVHEPEPAQLELRELPTGTVAFSGRTETFRIESAVAVFGGTHLALTGYFRGEGKDSLAVVPITELAQPAEILFRRFREKRPIADYAYRLAAGPCGNDALVIFRDPEDDEVPDDDDDGEVDTTAKADVRGLRGFYVRAADGSLRAKLDWDGGMKSHARLAATRSWIAAECDAQIALLPVTGAPWPGPVAARWLAESPDGNRVLVETENGALAVLSLPE